jgi:hypothetical protein
MTYRDKQDGKMRIGAWNDIHTSGMMFAVCFSMPLTRMCSYCILRTSFCFIVVFTAVKMLIVVFGGVNTYSL